MSVLIFKHAKLVLSDKVVEGALIAENGQIQKIIHGNDALEAHIKELDQSKTHSIIECEGDYIAPGFVELHTDNLERHIQPRPGTNWPIRPAILAHDRELVSCGITTTLNAVCIGEAHSEAISHDEIVEAIEAIIALAEKGHLQGDHYIHLRCEITHGGLLDLLKPLIALPRLKLISVMDHTPGQRQYSQVEKYAEYYQGKFNMADDTLQDFITARRQDQKIYAAQNRKDVVAAAHQAGMILASHDDENRAQVREAVEEKIAIAEFPTSLEAAQHSHENGLAVLMGGPNLVRGGSHSGNVSAIDLAQKAWLDIVSSDYVPASLLQSAFILADQVEHISLSAAFAMMSKTPAEKIGLTDRGEIAVGKRADLLRIEPGSPSSAGPVLKQVWCAGAAKPA